MGWTEDNVQYIPTQNRPQISFQYDSYLDSGDCRRKISCCLSCFLLQLHILYNSSPLFIKYHTLEYSYQHWQLEITGSITLSTSSVLTTVTNLLHTLLRTRFPSNIVICYSFLFGQLSLSRQHRPSKWHEELRERSRRKLLLHGQNVCHQCRQESKSHALLYTQDVRHQCHQQSKSHALALKKPLESTKTPKMH